MWEFEESRLAKLPMHKNQHGFRGGQSTETALTTFLAPIEQAIIRDQFSVVALLDAESAFNMVTYSSLLGALKARGGDERFVSWYGSYLNNRTISVNHKGIKAHRACTRGVGQGCVISPIAYNLATEGALSLFDTDTGEDTDADLTDPHPGVSIKGTAYADDLAFQVQGSDLVVLQEKMQWAMNKLTEWATTVGLSFSVSKTKILVITRKYKWSFPPKICLYNHPVSYVRNAMYLGVNINDRLSWKPHLVDYKIPAAKKKLMAITNCSGQNSKSWGLPPKSMLYAYKGIVRAGLLYGSLVWASACRHKGIQAELTKLQRLALKSMGPMRERTPTRGLELLTYTCPLELEVRKSAAEAAIRTKKYALIPFNEMYSHIGCKKGHRQYCEEFLYGTGFSYSDTEFDEGLLRRYWSRRFVIDKQSLTPGEHYGVPKLDTGLQLWSDGSLQSDGQTGAGVYICGGLVSRGYRLGKGVSIWQAELYAILKNCEWILNNPTEVEGKLVVINVDSQSAILALEQVHVRSKCLAATLDILNKAADVCDTLKIRWIKSHQDNNPLYLGNHNADALAVQAAKSGQPVEPDAPKPNKVTWKQDLRKAADGLWTYMWWNDLPTESFCRQTKHWFPFPQPVKSFKLVNLPRQKFGTLVQLMTGHNFLNRHEFVVFGATEERDPMCEYCDFNYVQTSAHVIGECPSPQLMEARVQFFGFQFMEPPFMLPIPAVLKFLQSAGIEALAIDAEEGVKKHTS